jgi:hypothetical protein
LDNIVFVEFISSNYPLLDGKHYFAGESLEAILKDTYDGSQFGVALFTSHRVVSEIFVRSQGFGLVDEAISAIQKYESFTSFKLEKSQNFLKEGMVTFIKFTSSVGRDYYFVGITFQDIMDMTGNGKGYDGINFIFFKVVERAILELLQFESFDQNVRVVYKKQIACMKLN